MAISSLFINELCNAQNKSWLAPRFDNQVKLKQVGIPTNSLALFFADLS